MQVRYLNTSNLSILNSPKSQREQNFDGKVTLKIPKKYKNDEVFCKNTKIAFEEAKKQLQIIADKYKVDLKFSIKNHKKQAECCSLQCKIVETSNLFGSVIHNKKSCYMSGIFNKGKIFVEAGETAFKKLFSEKSQWD